MDDLRALQLLFREIRIIDDEARARLLAVLPEGLAEHQFELLSHLSDTSNRDETPSDLARVFRVSRPAMTQTLGRMVARGLVTLDASATDGRVRHVRITRRGGEARDAVLAALGADFAAMAARVDGATVAAMLEDLRRFRAVVEALAAHGGQLADAT
ncbi:MAG TPA: MarR family transcriptional regulator [Pseudomonadales bacterium]|nr:MarR family transcriptional regulator [Pseudomonadales bacterium]